MNNYINYTLLFFAMVLGGAELQAQYGYGYGSGYGYGYGRQRNAIPQVEQTPKEPEPKTAEQIVDAEMPKISETLELNEFESAVLSSILKKYVQKRIEMQILELSPEQMREGMEKITKAQDEELKAGLPLEKYEAFVEMQKKGIQKAQKEKKKEKKRKKKKNKDQT
ncbi:hypothetical protein [Pseudozobellia thermophila]|uniref:Uncharacterized protein n=1 Tax=Pseudozobellia thermophila TaxID=192903 RepID=A0A1M6LBJ0_9FLAO|nr:hypothetical protein [Pseudozobellia thermophila]SHJ68590.1 hypothetical protein SAMN04488513_10798 [Pseudozobellia thermophila]